MSMRRSSRWTAFDGGCLVMACLRSAGPASAQDAFRFGLAMPLTGSQALYGQDQVKAAEWAVAEINKAGGINGKKLEMIVLDTQADPQLGIQMVEPPGQRREGPGVRDGMERAW